MRSYAYEKFATKNIDSILNFESRVNDLIASGAGDRGTAIKWLRDTDPYFENDDGYMEFEFHLPFGYLKETSGLVENK
jgi:hypothetical protein